MRTKVFQSGNSQAVRIPKEFRFDSSVVEIFQRDNEIVLKPIPKSLGDASKLLTEMPSDLMVDGRNDDEPQSRDTF